MRRLWVLLAALGAAMTLALHAASIDFGGSLTNTTAYGSSSDFVTTPGSASNLLQKDSGNLWFQAALSDALLFTAQAGATFQLTPGLASQSLFFADADLLSLEGTFPSPDERTSLFHFALGRIVLAEFTGLVFNHRADGFSLRLDYPAAV